MNRRSDDLPEPEADHADVDPNRLHREPMILERPVEALDGFAETLRRRRAPGGTPPGRESGNRTRRRRSARADPLIAGRAAPAPADRRIAPARAAACATRSMMRSPTAWPSASLYHLKPVMSTRPDRAPAAALLERQERLELLGEAAEVHQLGLGIAMGLVGQVGDQRLEVARDAADGGILGGQLGLHVRHLVGEAGRERLNRFLLRFLPQTLVPAEDRVNRHQQRLFQRGRQRQPLAHPRLQLAPRLRQRQPLPSACRNASCFP